MLSEDEIDSSVSWLGIGRAICLDIRSLLDGATGRQLLHLLQALLQRKTSLVLWVSFTVRGEGTVYSDACKSIHSSHSGFSFLVFNLLCAPCFAAMGAIKREMNSAKWTLVCNRISVWFRIPCIPCYLQNCRTLHRCMLIRYRHCCSNPDHRCFLLPVIPFGSKREGRRQAKNS